MQFRKLGYYIICSSPLVSLLVVWITIRSLLSYQRAFFGTEGYDWRIPVIGLTLANSFIIGLQLFGLLLYLTGYKKERRKRTRSPFTGLIIISLIVLGIAVSWFIWGFYQDMMLWSMEEGVRELIVWDHLQYATWILNGILWIVAGVVIRLTTKSKPRHEGFDISNS